MLLIHVPCKVIETAVGHGLREQRDDHVCLSAITAYRKQDRRFKDCASIM